jgi:single-stranded-DNA-specific exonuclease
LIKFDENSKFKDISQVIIERFENKDFLLQSSLEDLHNPYLLKDMDKAVNRIKKAKENEEKVVIF